MNRWILVTNAPRRKNRTYEISKFGEIINFCVESLGDILVTLTLPTGDVETFKAVASPECRLYHPVIDVKLSFEPIDDTLSTLTQRDFANSSALRLYNGNLVELNQWGQSH